MKFPKLRFTLVLIALLGANFCFAGPIEGGKVTIDLPAFREISRSPEMRDAMREKLEYKLNEAKKTAEGARSLGFASVAELEKFQSTVNELNKAEHEFDTKTGAEKESARVKREAILAEHYNKYTRVLRDADIASFDAQSGRFKSSFVNSALEAKATDKAAYQAALRSIAASEQAAKSFVNAHEAAASLGGGLGEAINAHRFSSTDAAGPSGKAALEAVTQGLNHLKAATSAEGLKVGERYAKLETVGKEGQPSEKENVEQIFRTLLLTGAEAKDFKAIDDNMSIADVNERQDTNRGYAKVARMVENEMREKVVAELKKLGEFSETKEGGVKKTTAELMEELRSKNPAKHKEVMEEARKSYEAEIVKLLKERLPEEEQIHMACGAQDGSGSCLPNKLTGAEELKGVLKAKGSFKGAAGLCNALFQAGNAVTKQKILAVLAVPTVAVAGTGVAHATGLLGGSTPTSTSTDATTHGSAPKKNKNVQQ